MSVSLLQSNLKVTGSNIMFAPNLSGIGGTQVIQSGNFVLFSGAGGGGGISQIQLDSVSGWTDNTFVHKTGIESISGDKTFHSIVTIIGAASGALRLTTSRADAINKIGRIVGTPYNTGGYDFLSFDIRGLSTSDEINYGGGSSFLGTVNQHVFYTATGRNEIGGTARMIISNSGNVGIGTNNPTNKLSISGAKNEGITINGIGTVFLATHADNTTVFALNIWDQTGGVRFYDSIDGGQNYFNSITLKSGVVGIGTTTPNDSHRLTIGGSTNIGGGAARLSINATSGKQSTIIFDRENEAGYGVGHDIFNNGEHNFGIYDRKNAALRFAIDNDGNTKIGGSFSGMGGYYSSSKSVSQNYSILPTDNRIYFNNTTGIRVLFPNAVGASGQEVKLKLINTGQIIMTGTHGQFFDGLPSIVQSGRYFALEAHSDGANWYLW